MKSRGTAFLNLLQTIAIVAGLAYGAVELGQFRTEQRREAETEVARSFLSPELMDAFSVVMSMPDSLTLESYEADYADQLPHLLLLAQTFETVGIMVFNGDVRLETVDEFLGTPILFSWGKLETVYLQNREAFQAPGIAEWFQWLAERLQEYREGGAIAPAYEAFEDWSPRG